jgi:hypothetical protein
LDFPTNSGRSGSCAFACVRHRNSQPDYATRGARHPEVWSSDSPLLLSCVCAKEHHSRRTELFPGVLQYACETRLSRWRGSLDPSRDHCGRDSTEQDRQGGRPLEEPARNRAVGDADNPRDVSLCLQYYPEARGKQNTVDVDTAGALLRAHPKDARPVRQTCRGREARPGVDSRTNQPQRVLQSSHVELLRSSPAWFDVYPGWRGCAADPGLSCPTAVQLSDKKTCAKTDLKRYRTK